MTYEADSTWALPAAWNGEQVPSHKLARGDDEYGDGALSFSQFRGLTASPRRGESEDVAVRTPEVPQAPENERKVRQRSGRFLPLD